MIVKQMILFYFEILKSFIIFLKINLGEFLKSKKCQTQMQAYTVER